MPRNWLSRQTFNLNTSYVEAEKPLLPAIIVINTPGDGEKIRHTNCAYNDV